MFLETTELEKLADDCDEDLLRTIEFELDS